MSENTDALIFGKNIEKHLVALEIEDDVAVLYEQNPETGKVTRREEGHRYWVLSNRELDNRFKRLKGNLYYRYGALVKTKNEFYAIKNQFRNENLYGVSDPREAHMIRYGRTLFKDLKHDQVSVLAFDIETTGLHHDEDSKVLLIANTFRDSKGQITRRLFAYDEYENDGDFLKAWIDWVVEIDPSVLVGHNVYKFDLPYIDFCCSKANVIFSIGRERKEFKVANYESRFRKDGSQTIGYNKVIIYGRSVIDTMFLSIKYDVARNFTSYGLKSIIKELGKEVEGRVFYDAAKIKDNHLIPEEWSIIKQYAEHDGDDALTLYDLMIPSFFYWTQNIPKTFQSIIESATGSQINSLMMRSYLQDGHSLPKTSIAQKFPGALSVGNPGVYRNVLKWDISSLYPSIMIQYEIYDQNKDPNANFLKMVKAFREQRLENKRKAKETGLTYFRDMEQSQKIGINSAYGTLGANGLLFNSPKNAALVTEKGREILQQAIVWATNKRLETKLEEVVSNDEL